MSNGDNKRVDAERPRGGGRAIPRGAPGELLGRRLGFDGRPRVRVAGLMAPAGCIWGGETARGVEVEDGPRQGALPNPSRRRAWGTAVDGAGAAVGVRETVEEAVEGSGRGRRRRCTCGGAGGAGGKIGQPDGPSVSPKWISPKATVTCKYLRAAVRAAKVIRRPYS